MHLLYRRLYYIPIIYAAFVFGKRGGAITALVAIVPFVSARAVRGAGSSLAMGFDNWIEIVSFLVVGVLVRGDSRHGGEQDPRSAAGLSAA